MKKIKSKDLWNIFGWYIISIGFLITLGLPYWIDRVTPEDMYMEMRER